MLSVGSRLSAGLGLFFLAAGAQAATLDFTIVTGGFKVQSFSGLPAAGGSISNGDIVSEAGFSTITLDVIGSNVDVFIDDLGVGNPYFDDKSSGRVAGLGSCTNLTSAAQCTPSSDDNITIGQDERLSLDFRNDLGAALNVSLGDFVFRDDQHFLLDNSDIQVTVDGVSQILTTDVNGVIDFSVLGPVNELIFNDLAGSDANFYITSAEITAVPVPAAVWLFGSALGALGWLRRKGSA